MQIKGCRPKVALPGGLVKIELDEPGDPSGFAVWVGDVQADVLGAGPTSITVRLPEAQGSQLTVVSGKQRASHPIRLGQVLADELHPVANPVVDPAGRVFVTFSGTRGESVPFGVYIVSPEGTKEPFLGDITNPTGLAFGPDGLLYISSRHTGTVYRTTLDKQVEKFVDGLGIASGLTFDSKGNLFVGDRSGFIYRVGRNRVTSLHCELEPSVSAYHLACDASDYLYVTGPTLATQDAVYRVDPEGTVEVFFKGLGRPQGLAFDAQGRLHVVGSYRGRKGVFVFDGEPQKPEMKVASSMMVGLAFGPGDSVLYLVDNSTLYRVEL
jgi:sugar lactone lactonase YvrE